MARTLSATALAAMFAQQTGQVFLPFITMDGDSLDAPLRLVANTEDVTRDGNVYTAYPFTVEVPADDAEKLTTFTLRLCNVDRSLIPVFRDATEALTVELVIALASAPNTELVGPVEFTTGKTVYDALEIRSELICSAFLDEPFPGDAITPGLFPGSFG